MRQRLCSIVLAAAASAALAQPDHIAPVPLDDAALVSLDETVDVSVLDPAELHGPLPGLPLPGSSGADAAGPDDATDEEIDTFAAIYVDLQREARRVERAIAQADSEEEAQRIQARLQAESLDVLERHGWSVEDFDRVTRALNRRPDLAEKALSAIEEKD